MKNKTFALLFCFTLFSSLSYSQQSFKPYFSPISKDPHNDRLFTAPTGRTLSKGTLNMVNTAILQLQGYYSYVNYGVTDYANLSGGFFYQAGGNSKAMVLSPKVRVFHSSNADISAGIISFTPVVDNKWSFAENNILYASGTYSLKNRSFNAGVGIEINNRSSLEAASVLLHAGADFNINEDAKFYTENYYSGAGSTLTTSAAFRFYGELMTWDVIAYYSLSNLGSGNIKKSLMPAVSLALNL